MTCRYQLGKTSDYNFSCCCSVAKLCPTLCDPWTAASQASLSFTISWSLFKLMSIESVMLSNCLIVCHPLLLFPQSFPASESFPCKVSSFHQVAKILEPWLQHQSFKWVSNEGWFSLGLTGLISLLSKGLLRVFSSHNSKASILWLSAFFMVHLSQLYMTTWKTIALTIQTFVSKVMPLLFNMLSMFVIAFLPRSKSL